eukprot:804964-Amphidinium_carterae.1
MSGSKPTVWACRTSAITASCTLWFTLLSPIYGLRKRMGLAALAELREDMSRMGILCLPVRNPFSQGLVCSGLRGQ